MTEEIIHFTLPIGYEDEHGNYHREGIMRASTAIDEIEVNRDERTFHGKYFRDCLVFARVITKLGSLNGITHEVIENLFETDFLYLQLLYNRLNTDFEETLSTSCPECGNINKSMLSEMYKVMHHYYANPDQMQGKPDTSV